MTTQCVTYAILANSVKHETPNVLLNLLNSVMSEGYGEFDVFFLCVTFVYFSFSSLFFPT